MFIQFQSQSNSHTSNVLCTLSRQGGRYLITHIAFIRVSKLIIFKKRFFLLRRLQSSIVSELINTEVKMVKNWNVNLQNPHFRVCFALRVESLFRVCFKNLVIAAYSISFERVPPGHLILYDISMHNKAKKGIMGYVYYLLWSQTMEILT